MTSLSIIVAYSRNRVIGKDNQLPWRLPSDLAHFKRQTSGHPIIMGRKTWESLGRPLPNRHNIVISRKGIGDFTGATRVHSLEEAIAAAGPVEQAFIIGGSQLYEQSLPAVDEVIATEIDADIEGDAFFAPLLQTEWVEYSREGQAPENGLPFSFVTYRRMA
jgi:dihydrofolate reductase